MLEAGRAARVRRWASRVFVGHDWRRVRLLSWAAAKGSRESSTTLRVEAEAILGFAGRSAASRRVALELGAGLRGHLEAERTEAFGIHMLKKDFAQLERAVGL